MACLFLSFWKDGKFPLCSIGPSWPFTIGLLIFASICLGYLVFMIYMMQDPTGWCTFFSIIGIIINLGLLCGGIMGDPGVSPSTYLYYTKLKYAKSKDTEFEEAD
jgi:hypothetical protein